MSRPLAAARAFFRTSPARSLPRPLQGSVRNTSRHAPAHEPHAAPGSPLVPKGYPANRPKGAAPSMYGVWYREIFPAMIPIFLMSTAIFLSLSLLRTHLSHSRSLAESGERIEQLEAQLARLRAEAKRRQERERRERERILPLVVERVLQRVGAMGPEEDIEVEEERLLV